MLFTWKVCSTCSNALTSSFVLCSFWFLCTWYTDRSLTSLDRLLVSLVVSVLSHVHHLCADRSQTEELNADFQASLCLLTKPGVGAKDGVATSPCYPGNCRRGEPPGGTADLSWLLSTELESMLLPRDPVGRSAPKQHLDLQGCVQCNQLSWVKRSSLNWQMVTISAIVIEIYMADEHMQGSLKTLFL